MTEAKTPTKPANVWSDEERAAMQASARERRGSRRNPADERAEGESAFRESMARMPDKDRVVAERIDAIVMAAVPELARKTYYGMPAYAQDGNVIFWIKNAGKFKMRYDTLEFSDKAHLDDGAVWPVSFAVKEMTAAAESRIVSIVKQAAG